MKEIVKYLISNKRTISTMESCTGGAIASSITNISGSSEIFKFGAVTYSNEYKIKIGVRSSIIDKYTVYSIETAKEMSKVICNYTSSNYGIGVTGKLRSVDPNNRTNDNNRVYISIYNKDMDKYYTYVLVVNKLTRKGNKKMVINTVIKMFKNIIKENN